MGVIVKRASRDVEKWLAKGARRRFVVLGISAVFVAVGIALGLTALSFGGAAPVLALACASLGNSIGDAACAYRNVKNAEAVAGGREPPYNLPGGNSLFQRCPETGPARTAVELGA